MSAAAINAMVSPWFVRTRPAALTSAYNGASVAGIVFSPLWVAAIGLAWISVGGSGHRAVTIGTIWIWPTGFWHGTSQQMGLFAGRRCARNDECRADLAVGASTPGKDCCGAITRFITLAAGMALGLFAQIGLSRTSSRSWCRRLARSSQASR